MKEQVQISSKLVSWVESILKFGNHSGLDRAGNFTLNFLNALALSGIIVPVLAVLLVEPLSFIPHVVFIIISSIVLWLNYNRKYETAKFLLIVLVPLIQSYSVIYLERINSGSELTIIPFIVIIPFIYKLWKVRLILISYLTILFISGISSREYPISEGFIFNAVIVVLGISMGIYLLVEHLNRFTEELATKNLKLEEQNTQLEKLVRQNDIKTELLTILSHDLKGPAHTFNMLSEKVAFLLRKNEYQTLLELADSFEASSKNLFRNIDYLLNWTLSEKEFVKIHVAKLNIKSLIHDLIQTVQLEKQKKYIQVEIRIPEDQSVLSDLHLVSIILKNIIDNAIKYSPPRSLISIECADQDDFVILTISDFGPGIQQEIVQNIKSGKVEKSKDGFGIGLSICFSLIKRLGGEIKFALGDIVGTRVEIYLPNLKLSNQKLAVLSEESESSLSTIVNV